jgi:hypothetical protein
LREESLIVTKREIIEVFSKVAEIISNGIRVVYEALKNVWSWIKENRDKLFLIPEIQKQRNIWFKQEFNRTLNAHKQGNPMYLSHQIINRKPKQNFARNNL